MPSYNQSTRDRVADINVGLRVDKHTHPVVTGQNAVFHVHGRNLLIDLIGEVTDTLEAAALLLHWDFDADIGGGGDAALCINSADLTGTAAGNLLILPAAAASALTVPAQGYLKLFPAVGWVLNDGFLDLHASAGNTGGITWSCYYVPLEDGAYIDAE